MTVSSRGEGFVDVEGAAPREEDHVGHKLQVYPRAASVSGHLTPSGTA
jgi:hypothetical protein